MDEIVQFDFPTDSPKIIKVIGVGGGGGNAVNHMYREGIHDVTFVLCNTDNQALAESPVPVKLQLGRSITQGLGAGNRPERARDAAEESIEDIRNQLNDGTKMVFITAGMGGGTGTGAAPVIARIAKEMDILTVGIVTIPFIFEGEKKIIQALDGVERIAQHVDALLVINNERLREIYADLTFMNAFGKADDTLSIAAKSIAEIITMRGTVNLDFADVKTILKDGGVAIMSTGFGEGENRVTKAIDDALHSPLLNNNDIFNAKESNVERFFLPVIRANDGGDERDTRVHEQIPRRGGSDLGCCHRQLTGNKSKNHRIGNRIRCGRRSRNGQLACCTQPGRGRTSTATGRREREEQRTYPQGIRRKRQQYRKQEPPQTPPHLSFQHGRSGQRRYHRHGRRFSHVHA